MWEWLTQNSSGVQTTMSAVTALIWLVYLQLLLTGVRRQRRTQILINLGGSTGLKARTIVSNLAYEPIYVLEGLLTIRSSDGLRVSSIIDRTEADSEDLQSLTHSTLQGPLRSGHFMDLGSVEDILDRARTNRFETIDAEDIKSFEIKIAAVTAARSNLVAARREFVIDMKDDGLQVRSTSISSIQIRSWWGRRKLRHQLEARLQDEVQK